MVLQMDMTPMVMGLLMNISLTDNVNTFGVTKTMTVMKSV
jgi:hypothetical protein